MAVSDFNPDQSVRNLPSLRVEKKDGSIITVPAGRVRLQAGANISIETDEETDEIIIRTSEGTGQEDAYFREKYEALANTPETGTVTGGEGTPEKPIWTFSAAARWIAAFNEVLGTAVDRNFFFNSSDCTSFGLFDQEVIGYPEDVAYKLRVVDVCAPANNILLIRRLKEYISRLAECFDYLLAVLDNEDPTNPPTPPDDIDQLFCDGYFQQMQIMRHYWNYLVNRASVKFSASSSGQGVSFSTYFRNSSDNAVGDVAEGVKIVVTLELLQRSGGSLIPWANLSATQTELRPITRDNADDPPNKLLGWDTTFNVSPTVATATFKTIKDATVYQLPPGGEVYADAVVLFKNMDEFDDGGEYVMRMTSKTHFTHMDTTIDRTVDVYFTPPVNVTPVV